MTESAPTDRTGTRLLLVALGLVLAFAAAGGGIWWYISGRFDAATVPMEAWELPGLRVGMPRWVREDTPDDEIPGHVTLTAVHGEGRYMEIRWSPSAGISADQAVTAFAGGAGVEELERRTVRVDGKPSFISYLEGQGGEARVAYSLWRCPESGLTYQLTSFVSLPKEPLIALHERVLETADCAPLAAGEAPEPVFPVFDPPEGFTKADDEDATQVWEGGERGLFDLTPGTPGRRAAEVLHDTPALRAQSARAEFRLEEVHFEHEPVTRPGPDGAERQVHVAHGRDRAGSPVRVLMTWFYCPEADQTFLAFHAGPPEQDRAPLVDALAALRCPEASP